MPLVLKDRVKETSTTTGTGTLTLGGAATGFQSFAVIGNGNTTYYALFDRTSQAWEVGVGTYTSSGTTLSRDVVLESSNSGSLVNFGAGTKDVFCTYPAEKAVTLDDVQTLTNKTISGSNNTLSNIGNASLTNSSLTIGSTNIALGGTAASLAGLTGVTATTFTGALSGNATTATTLQTARAINGTNFNGTAAITTANWGTARNVTIGNTTRSVNGSTTYSWSLSDIGALSLDNPSYTGTLTGGTGVINIGSGQLYKDASGNVGIGVIPAFQFETKTANDAILRFVNSGAIQNSQIQSTNLARSAFSPLSIGGSTTVLETGGTERMRIDSAGNVGIGTSSPAQALSVSGNIAATGSIDCGTQFLGLAADSAAAPSFSFTGDTDTGMFRSGTNQVSLTTGGTDRMRITSAGKILASAGTNWVGTVSQNGLSSIIEQGSNANGRFVKYADGTQICYLADRENRSVAGVTVTSVTLPVAFVDANVQPDGRLYIAQATMNTGVPATATTIAVSSISTTSLAISINRSTSTNTVFFVTVTGRWY